MKRKLILLVVTIVFLVGFGVILHSPPSMIDAVTGAKIGRASCRERV